ncbi:single-stranded DNA-binding protein [Escherichia coli]
MLNHTTHPQGRDLHNLNKYIWRFIALSTAQPRVITIEATSEQEARQQSPAGCVMVSVLAFGRQADALAKHHKGELVSVAGNIQVSQWTGQNGETRQGWQVIADSVISARTARPGGKKGQQGQATDALNRAKQQTGQHDDPYGDGIPF